MTQAARAALTTAWDLLPGSTSPHSDITFSGPSGLASAFDVDAIASASAGAARRAARELHLARGNHGELPNADVVGPGVAAAFAGPLLIDDKPIPKWADLSGYYRTADDRAVQFHANFDHHAAGIVSRLGCEANRSSVEAATATWTADDLETALVADGMIAAKLRTLEEWQQHPHARATADLPLISVEQIGDAPPLPRAPGVDPCSELRVVDCSRVLAGPVAGQTLAELGADVLRVGSPGLPSVPVCVMSTGFGKRNCHVDLTSPDGQSTFAKLLSSADVWVDAFRPNAFANRGFTPQRAAELRPGIVVVQLSAFDWEGPWAGRRGFDSIVQSTTGIVDAGTSAAGKTLPDDPTPLPVQALDYASGYLAAAGAMRAVQHQAVVGGSWLVRLSLLRTRNWLVDAATPSRFAPAPPVVGDEHLRTVESEFGQLTAAQPVVGTHRCAPRKLGTSEAVWL